MYEAGKTSSRRGFLQTGIALPVAASVTSGVSAAAPATANVYTRLGVRPFINAVGTLTTLSGTLMSTPVVQAMEEASAISCGSTNSRRRLDAGSRSSPAPRQHSLRRVPRRHCAWPPARSPRARIRRASNQLPDLTGMKSELIIQKAHRNSYDHAFRMVGLSW